jgi:hypothetical protein
MREGNLCWLRWFVSTYFIMLLCCHFSLNIFNLNSNISEIYSPCSLSLYATTVNICTTCVNVRKIYTLPTKVYVFIVILTINGINHSQLMIGKYCILWCVNWAYTTNVSFEVNKCNKVFITVNTNTSLTRINVCGLHVSAVNPVIRS